MSGLVSVAASAPVRIQRVLDNGMVIIAAQRKMMAPVGLPVAVALSRVAADKTAPGRGRFLYGEPACWPLSPIGGKPRLYDRPIGPHLVSQYARPAGPSAKAVLAAIAGRLKVAPEHIMGTRRFRLVTPARRLAAYVLVRHVGLSLTATGRVLRRDHTTVLYHVRMAGAALAGGDAALAADLDAVLAALDLPRRGGEARP